MLFIFLLFRMRQRLRLRYKQTHMRVHCIQYANGKITIYLKITVAYMPYILHMGTVVNRMQNKGNQKPKFIEIHEVTKQNIVISKGTNATKQTQGEMKEYSQHETDYSHVFWK